MEQRSFLSDRVVMRREITVVLYHHIAKEEVGLTRQLSIAIAPDAFEKHIKYFSKNFDFVSGTDLIDGNLPRKPILITFDDAYRSVLDVGHLSLEAFVRRRFFSSIRQQ